MLTGVVVFTFIMQSFAAILVTFRQSTADNQNQDQLNLWFGVL
jgi:hypothetical protein